MDTMPEGKIETTVEMTSELPESLKAELRKKRRKLKEKKLKTSSEEKSFELEEIRPQTEEETLLLNSPPVNRPKPLPRIPKRNLPLPPERLSNGNQLHEETLHQQSTILQPLRPLPPPRKSKKLYELQELVSLTSKAEKLSLNGTEGTPTKTSNDLDDSEDNYYAARKEKNNPRQKRKVSKETFPKFNGSSSHSQEEAEEISDYDFFTRVWDQDTVLVCPPVDSTEIVDGTSEEDTDSVRLIQKELQKSGVEIVQLEPASYVPFKIKIEKERNSFFHPSYKPVPMKLKIPESTEPKSGIEEESVIAKMPNVSSRNMNTLENRLLFQKEFQWFGEDGLVKMLPDPVCDSPIRQVPTDTADNFPLVEYVKASLNSEHFKLKSEGGKGYRLELDISSICFLHHPLFSTEHVIESRLLQMCDKHLCNVKEDLLSILKYKLKELRTSVSNLKQSLQKGMQETSVNNERHIRLKQLQKDIRQTKKLRDLKEFEQKSLWASIIGTWEELKLCRQNQLFTSTSLNLKIQEERPNRATEKEEWERELTEELEEETEDYESCSEKLFEEYESALARWKQWSKDRKLALKRHKLRQKQKDDSQAEEENEEDLLATKLQDEKILSEPEMPKPKPVPKFNAATTHEKLKSNSIKMRRSPGEPILHITIDHDTPITPINECPRDEVQRRNAVSKKKLYFKIMFNDKKVSETCEKNIGQDFKAVWGQIFKLQILHAPQSVRIEILEGGFINGTLVAELFIPIPAAAQTSSQAKLVDHQFSSDKYNPPKSNSVGSGVSHKFKDGTETFLLANGVLKCSLTWGVDEDGNVLVPSNVQEHRNETENANPISHLLNSRFFNVNKLRQWIKKSNLDPQNAENAAIFKFLQEVGLDVDCPAEDLSTFHLDPMCDELELCSAEELESSKRFQLLNLRAQEEGEFQHLRMVPANEEDIKEDLVECLKRRASDIQKKDNEGEEQREQAKILMQKVREEVAKRFYVSQHQKLLEDVVTEEKVPSIGTIGFSILKLFQTKRPLYPERKDRKKIICSNANLDVKIIVRILHASNVPVRKDTRSKKDMKQNGDDCAVFFESQVQPFVEVMFQRTAIKTGIAEGPHPTWNEELELPFRALNDNYTPSSLEGVKDVVYINLFDEITVNLLEEGGGREGVVHERLERRWLGNLKVPFTTLYLNSKIEGTFRVNIPPVLLSYENEPRPWLTGLSDAASNHTYLSFFMTIEPCLPLPDVFRDQFDSTEPEKVLAEVEKWRQSVIPRYPDRMIKLMAVDLSGKWIFVTRYLRPLPPPEELTNGNQVSVEVMELLARFVSLFPTVADSVAFPGLCDIWSTSDQFLQLLTGDEEEHALLLCSFFLHLGKRSMLLLGSGVPEGPTAYVATWGEGGEVDVWNASSGEHFGVSDNHCPLQSVGCLIGPENVWANIQRSSHPSRINFDLNRTSDWKPFFNRSFPNPGLRSIQPSSLTYTTTDPEYVEKLQESIEKCLKESVEKWRKNMTTVWNKKCNKVLYKVLKKLERNVGRTASDDSLQELEHMMDQFKMDGFPLTMPYTDTESVIETVFATGIHLTEDATAEFSVAVYIHPYPCCILAVWVYVAVLMPRKEEPLGLNEEQDSGSSQVHNI
ncbi:hypothetical protein JTE90_005504 [Oedothorax gibbosus]|uniref:Coiled-coil and C2 domain-containing protein 2A n=1 Tax=Oedothorax gibbosus TaxID=931172 RepID=A0AAV6UV25_9ARAC|nr:hypothetical protein JTE90_005504 [Oedothorax gibbosus]